MIFRLWCEKGWEGEEPQTRCLGFQRGPLLRETGEERGGLDARFGLLGGVVDHELLLAEFEQTVGHERVVDGAVDVQLALFLVEGDGKCQRHKPLLPLEMDEDRHSGPQNHATNVIRKKCASHVHVWVLTRWVCRTRG